MNTKIFAKVVNTSSAMKILDFRKFSLFENFKNEISCHIFFLDFIFQVLKKFIKTEIKNVNISIVQLVLS